MIEEIYLKFKKFSQSYKLSNYDIKKLWSIIKPICEHPEFQKRMVDPYWHHDATTLGEHILCDTIVTYKIVKKIKSPETKIINWENAILIAMFHDLYEVPWQNTFQKKKLINKHGFVHPVEAAINAITWYPEYFTDIKKATIIIDGIIHHMYPFPVRVVDNSNLELNNQKKYNKLPKRYKDIIEVSTKIGKIGKLSFRKSFYLEGIVMSKADKSVALKKELHSIDGYIAFISGHNKKLEKRSK
ncbi:MAG: hypothetical protein ACI4OT_04070 [Bacilli bacterium]